MAAAELLAGLLPGAPSLVIGAGTLVIALQPPGAKDLMASLFGINDKPVLDVAVVLVALVVGAGVGLLARKNLVLAAVAFVMFAAVGVAGTMQSGLVSPPLALLSGAVAVASGLLTLRVLLASAQSAPSLPAPTLAAAPASATPEPVAAMPADLPKGVEPMPDWARRRFLIQAGAFLGAAAMAGVVGRNLVERQYPSGPPAAAGSLPAVRDPAPALAADQSLSAPGLTPIVVPNDQFFRIDTTQLVPQVDVATWQLKVDGMVEHPLTFSYAELLAMPLVEQYVTIACVSNSVGGPLVGNTLWTGVRLKEILARAGVKSGATQIVGRSVDSFTVGFPTEWALDASREPMVALGMNRLPLPADHGYPARLIVPGLYGYVSATKWLSEIELTTDAFNGYWIPRGWAKDGPILTQSRIDNLGALIRGVVAGPVDLSGVAWAPDRGIERVEVKIDDGPWQQTMLSRAISKAAWVQWILRWQATPGRHVIEVRATDGTGAVQTDQQTGSAPDGARGHQRIEVTVH
jgi:DMSO/TMAO reductase YedYZ molybdopterin-dependent catalytic subunit